VLARSGCASSTSQNSTPASRIHRVEPSATTSAVCGPGSTPAVARSYVQLLLAEMRFPSMADGRDEAAPMLAGRASTFVAEL
jgi:hypothetical protein